LWNSASATEGKSKLLETLKGLGLNADGISDVLHGAFDAVKGNKTDDLLEALKTARGGLSLADLADRALNLGGTPTDKPWNALFRVGQNEIKLNLSGCVLNRNVYVNDPLSNTNTPTTVTSAVLTLTRNGNSLTANVTPNPADTTVTFAPAQWGAGEASGFGIFVNRSETATYVNPRLSHRIGNNGSNQREFELEINTVGGKMDVPMVVVGSQTITGQGLRFRNAIYENNYQIQTTILLECTTIDKPMTMNTIGSLQPQSRLSSFAKVSPTLTISSANTQPYNGVPAGACGIETFDGMQWVLSSTYTFAVSADGVISFDGKNVGDYLSGASYPNASYYESHSLSTNSPQNSHITVILDRNNKGFYASRGGEGAYAGCGGGG
jgi:hypothetical protein